MSVNIKICTFNLRVDNTKDGINQFIYRHDRVLEVINSEKPDIIGFQEALDSMRDWLSDALSDYVLLGCGRNEDYRGESTVIAVRREKFEIVSHETFWLSYTPSVPGSTFGGDQSRCPRICTSALLRHRETSELLRFCNTHLDHKGENAKLLGIAEVMQYISKFPEKFVLTGDFNAHPDSQVISVLNEFVHNGRQVSEATRNITRSFHDFGRRNPQTKIDYIFTDAVADPDNAKLIDLPPVNGIYVSDHHPLTAIITLG